MKLKHFLAGSIAMLTFSLTFTACSSDDETEPVDVVDEIVETVADEWVGTWNYSDFTLILTNSGIGQIKKTTNGETSYTNFVYSYNKTKNVLSCASTNGQSFKLKDIHLDSNGNLVITHTLDGTEKTESGVKYVEEEKPADRTYTAPEKMVGKWAFSDFTITIDKQMRGIIEYSNGSNVLPGYKRATSDDYKSFTFMYSPSRNTLYATPTYGDDFTFKDIAFSEDGNTMTVTHNINGKQTTETVTKVTFSPITAAQVVGKWYSETKNDVYFNFSADGTAVLYDDAENFSGTWRTDGYSIFVTLNGKSEAEVVRYITISGNEMKAQVSTWGGGYQPFVLERDDDGSNVLPG